MKRIVTLIMLVLSFIILPSFYSWGQEAFKGLKVIPVPSSTKEVRKQNSQFMGNNFNATIYASKLSFKKIANFYNKKLTDNGWESLVTDKNIEKQIKSSIPLNQLIFIKDKEMVTISYLPTSAIAGETRFSLSRGKISFTEEAQRPAVEAMESIDVPVYPNATPVSFSFDLSDNKPLGYTTTDSAEKILQFYRDEMRFHRWILEEEVLPTQKEINPQDLEKIPQYERLSSLAIEQMGSFSMKTGHLVFKKGKRTCIVGVTEMLTLDPSQNQSIISLGYSK